MKVFRYNLKSLIITVVFLYGLTLSLHGQTDTTIIVKGKITSSRGGGPMSGVTVVEVNVNDRQVNAANTDDEGIYTLRVSDSRSRIRASYIGYESATDSIGSKRSINFVLKESSGDMEEVVITGISAERVSSGYGTTNKRDLIGAVSSVKGKDLEDQPQTSIDQMLQGRAAGVQIVSNSGDPGAGTNIRIRGAGSVSAGNEPLFIVDGVPIISSPVDPGNMSVAASNPLADINPSDIEQIDILKDANAAAIYGARAANGVVVITTKRGKKSVTNITLNEQLGIQTAPPAIPVLNGSQYKVMRLEAEQNAGFINPMNNRIRTLVDDPSYDAFRFYQYNTNWMDLITQTGLTHRHNLSVSGGGESMRYNFSTSYTDTKGAFINTGRKTYTASFRLDYTVSQKLRFSANVFFTRSKTNAHANYSFMTPYELALRKNPSLPVYDIGPDGEQLDTYLSLGANQSGFDNPVALVNTVQNDAFSTNLKPNIRLDYEIVKGLRYQSNASFEFVGENGITFLPAEATGEIFNHVNFNRIDNREFERRQIVIDNFLSYSKPGKSKLKQNYILGTTYNTRENKTVQARAYATPSGLNPVLGSAAGYSQFVSRYDNEVIVSAFAKADLIYNDTYGFNVTVRRDGSSKFGDRNRFGNFPSVGGYWRASNIPVIKNAPFISNLKFRASWGQLGNSNVQNYEYISQFSSGANYLGENGVYQLTPQLTNLRWETSESSNFGFDVDLFKNRLNVTFDAYNRLTKDLLFSMPIPSSSGMGRDNMRVNLGTISNKGMELTLMSDIVRSKKPGGFRWNVNFNIGRNINKILSMPGGTLIAGAGFANFVSQAKEGDPLGTYYGYVTQGVYATDGDAVVRDAGGNIVFELDGITPKQMKLGNENGFTFKGGDIIYKDFNHDGIINDQDKVLIGNANPDFFGGINNSFDYKNFTFRFFIQYQYGNDVVNFIRYTLERMQSVDNQAVSVLNRWRKQGDITDMPRALYTDDRNAQASTRWIEDGSYARLKFVTLSYRFPQTLLRRYKIKGMDAFLTGNDLFTWTNYTGADPEISLGWNPLLPGIDRGWNPRSRGVTLGLNIRL